MTKGRGQRNIYIRWLFEHGTHILLNLFDRSNNLQKKTHIKQRDGTTTV